MCKNSLVASKTSIGSMSESELETMVPDVHKSRHLENFSDVKSEKHNEWAF